MLAQTAIISTDKGLFIRAWHDNLEFRAVVMLSDVVTLAFETGNWRPTTNN
jgi:hypothetical protein